MDFSGFVKWLISILIYKCIAYNHHYVKWGIIEISNTEPFDISRLFWLIDDEKYDEYIPLIKNHLIQIIDHPELQFWKIHDAIELMLKLEPEFVHNLLEEKGKTLEDFKINTL